LAEISAWTPAILRLFKASLTPSNPIPEEYLYEAIKTYESFPVHLTITATQTDTITAPLNNPPPQQENKSTILLLYFYLHNNNFINNTVSYELLPCVTGNTLSK
jgi:hypothetical protein